MAADAAFSRQLEITVKNKDFIGKAVVSMADGARIGTVKELVFHGLDLASLVVDGERGEGLLPFSDVGRNGPDIITIESYTLVDWNAGKAMEPESRTSHDMKRLSVVDSEGNELGQVHDFTMNSKGRVQRIAVRTEGVFGIGAHETVVTGSQVRAVGPDIITVKHAHKK